jgi:hypothetical protein
MTNDSKVMLKKKEEEEVNDFFWHPGADGI